MGGTERPDGPGGSRRSGCAVRGRIRPRSFGDGSGRRIATPIPGAPRHGNAAVRLAPCASPEFRGAGKRPSPWPLTRCTRRSAVASPVPAPPLRERCRPTESSGRRAGPAQARASRRPDVAGAPRGPAFPERRHGHLPRPTQDPAGWSMARRHRRTMRVGNDLVPPERSRRETRGGRVCRPHGGTVRPRAERTAARDARCRWAGEPRPGGYYGRYWKSLASRWPRVLRSQDSVALMIDMVDPFLACCPARSGMEPIMLHSIIRVKIHSVKKRVLIQ
jgi:hypothetical protein